MATINVRLDDEIRDQLVNIADDRGLSLSEFIRELALEAVQRVWVNELPSGDEPAPKHLSALERMNLALHHETIANVLDPEVDPEELAKEHRRNVTVLKSGFAGEYWREYQQFQVELSPSDCRRVNEIMQMFSIISASRKQLEETGIELPNHYSLEFQGFDLNDSLEAHMASYLEFLIEDFRWLEFAPIVKDRRGNSHSPMLDIYMRMLHEFRRITKSKDSIIRAAGYLLSEHDLEEIEKASIHPANRK